MTHLRANDAIERALDLHASARRIRGWRRLVPDSRSAGWIVDLNRMPTALTLRSRHDAYLFIAGLASAAFAQSVLDPEPSA